jgi:N utilization substance protein A
MIDKEKEKANKQILAIVTSIANEKGIPEETIFQAVESALAAVAAKRFPDEVLTRVAIDRRTGAYETFRQWSVVADEDLEDPAQQLTLEQAAEIDAGLKINDVVEEPIESVDFGRIAAQQVKQIIVQKVREAERSKIASQFKRKVGDLIIGAVKKVTREYVILDMGENAEGLLTRDEMIPRELFRANDRVRALLFSVREDKRGPQLLVSRTNPLMLVELFKIEVPEIAEEVIEIKGVARDPGSRAKIAVKTNDGRIDPIGACVGMRGSRVQAVSNELGGERIDIILWDDNPAQLVINAMAPAEVSSIVVDEDKHTMDIIVKEEQLSQAIGRNGQNIRLASELTKWTLNVMTESEASAKHEKETRTIKQAFMEKLDVDEDIADILVTEGFTGIEEVAYVPKEEMLNIAEFDSEIVEELQKRASNMLLMQEIAGEEEKDQNKPGLDLMSLEGMTQELAYQLAGKGVMTRDDLGEFSVDELNEMFGIDQELAARLIMAARAHWFEKEKQS